MKNYILFTLVSLLTITSKAQIGRIEGEITDARNGAKIPSVNIQVLGTGKSIAADLDGKYSIQLDASKTYSIRFTIIGYKTKVVEEIKPVLNQIVFVNVILEQASKTEAAVEVRSSARKESTTALITLQKNTSVVAQVISAETIRRSPDKNTGEVLKRLAGASVQEGTNGVAPRPRSFAGSRVSADSLFSSDSTGSAPRNSLFMHASGVRT